ncbi:MAG TPA: IS21 family transposase [Phycisphaerales bacterium]|nr:IS21 family transposase [Phycisphaerales bacterium]
MGLEVEPAASAALEGESDGEVGTTDVRPMGAGSRCAPHRALVSSMLERGLSSVRIHADLRDEHGVELSYHSVRRFVAALGRTAPDPFRRMECAPGAEVQVDFGSGPTITIDGRKRRTHVLRAVLSHSRKGYSEAVLRQDAESFIRAIENAFRCFGGVPRTVVVDNLKAAVLKADWFDPDLNPKIVAFARHHGTVILPTKPYTPRHKGKVERAVAFVKDNALKGREFTTLAEINEHLLRWESTVADRRVHGTTRRQVGEHFESAERAALLPLPAGRFPCFREARRRVHRDGHVEVAKAYYSVPPEHLGRDVWARWDGRVVRILDSRLTQIAVHAQCEPGRHSTQDGHIASRKISSVERGAAYLISRARLIGRHAEQWAAQVVAERGVEALRTIAGLRSLAERHPVAQLERACKVAAGHGAHHLRDLRRLMRTAEQAMEQQSLEFVSEDPLIRPLEEYQRLASRAFRRGPAVAAR